VKENKWVIFVVKKRFRIAGESIKYKIKCCPKCGHDLQSPLSPGSSHFFNSPFMGHCEWCGYFVVTKREKKQRGNKKR
jgi:predicted  nucleic acid-binding Zn ribbon protein